jgi:antibiotic biosynthesis monooxygenase (ABM) superfamily enzyme
VITDGTVTVVVTRTVRAGRESSYEAWIHGVAEAAHAFPGHLGLTVVRPRSGPRDYTLIFRFDTVEHLRDWQRSQVCDDWAARANAISERAKVQQLSGMETWFALPGGEPFAPPPRWKMAVVSWLVAYPLIQGLNASLGPWLAPLPPVLRGAVLGLAMIVVMTYVAMPVVTRALARWLYPKP